MEVEPQSNVDPSLAAALSLTVTNTGTQKDSFRPEPRRSGRPGLEPGRDHSDPGCRCLYRWSLSPRPRSSFALPGPLGLTAIATSQSSPDVRQGASASLTIPIITGMTAQFSPASQTVAALGTATFLLDVNNTGNSEDQYSATIVSTSGPVIASLVGLDGQFDPVDPDLRSASASAREPSRCKPR